MPKDSSLHLQFAQLKHLTISQLQARYRKTWFGLLWVILNPVILMGVQSAVFSQIFRVPFDKYIPYLVSGFFPWIFVSQTVDMSAGMLKGQSPNIKAFNLSPTLVILSLVVENFFNFILSMLIVLVALAGFGSFDPISLLLWIPALLPLFLFAFAISFLVSTSNIILRDVRFVSSFLISILYFLTPIFYKEDMVPGFARYFILLNPMRWILAPFHAAVEENSKFPALINYGGAFAVALLALAMAFFIWNRIKNRVFLHL